VIDHTLRELLMMTRDDPVTEVSSTASPSASDTEAADGTEQKFDPSNINISILTPTGVDVILGPQPNSDSVIGIKEYLNTVLETCMYTSYEFEYVGGTGVVTINDYTELCTYFPMDRENPSERVTLRMVSTPYDVKAARAQVRRTADIIHSPPTKRVSGMAIQSSEVQPINISADKVAATTDQLPSLNVVFGEKATLNKFYEDTLHQFVTPSAVTANVLPTHIVSVACSGWNPPPPGRRASGDLLYVEVVLANHESFHVTATHSGFYVNKSTRRTFDPTCLQETPCFSHELMTTICQYCPSVQAAWQGLLAASPMQKKSSDGLEDLAEFSNLVALHEAGKDEQITITPSWIYLPPCPSMSSDHGGSKRVVDNGLSFSIPHRYDMLRAQEDAANTFGSDVFSPPREWNEEIQAIRALPVVTPHDKLTCLKYSQKIFSEFSDVCKSAAVAVFEGHIQPVNPNEIKDNHVYIFNNIFFSKAMESKESFKLCEGNEASRKYAALDLKNQRLIQSVNIQGLNTVLTAIVDYKGDRLVAQTVVPGILTPGERSARLLYGCLEHQKPISCKEVALSVLSEAASKLHLAKRNVKKYQALGSVSNKPVSNDGDTQSIRIDEEGEYATSHDPDSAVIPHIGPIEGKIIEGSDGRKYILEFMRLMPRDPNYVKGEKGTKLIDDEVLDVAG
jgi:protein TIF31